MLTVRRDALDLPVDLAPNSLLPDQPQQVIAYAAQLLSNLSHFVGVVMAPKRSSVFRHIEFLALSDHRVLVIIVSPDGDVQNRVVHTAVRYSQGQLVEASNYLNTHYAGMEIAVVRERLRSEVDALCSEITVLMRTAVDAGAQAMAAQDEVVISGERNLLTVSEFSHDLSSLRKMFDLFEQKSQLMRLLEISNEADGVRIFIGGEGGQVVPLQDLAVVSAPYEADGKVVGTLGVIGPQRMPYDKMIQIVDITSKLVSNALSQPR
jgi:heat-inducible transcriptional repressor